jgi:hypothetical protein
MASDRPFASQLVAAVCRSTCIPLASSGGMHAALRALVHPQLADMRVWACPSGRVKISLRVTGGPIRPSGCSSGSVTSTDG